MSQNGWSSTLFLSNMLYIKDHIFNNSFVWKADNEQTHGDHRLMFIGQESGKIGMTIRQ